MTGVAHEPNGDNRMKVKHITACLLILAVAACGQKGVIDPPATSDASDATDALGAEVVCGQVTDTACCRNGVLTVDPCVIDGQITCLNGGFPCNMMGGKNSECAQKCGADVQGDTSDAPDTVDSDPQPYAPVAATLPVQTTGCDATFAFTPMPSGDRPSSLAPCYVGATWMGGTHLPCLPWEWCDKGMSGGPIGPIDELPVTGSLTCKRPCETTDGPCPAGTNCQSLEVMDGDVTLQKSVCSGTTGGPWPNYSKGGAYPAEGGLSCWAPLATLGTYVAASHLARVGPHVYVLTAQAGVFADGAYHADARLWHAPLQVPSEATMTVVFDQLTNAPEWTGLGASADHLIAFQRKVPTLGQPPSGSPWLVLAGQPDSAGAVTLTLTGLEIPMPQEPGRALPGSTHACVARLDGVNPLLSCVQFDPQGVPHVADHALNVPAKLLSNIACYNAQINQTSDAPLRSMAVGGGRIAIVTGSCAPPAPAYLYVAPFDEQTDSVTGVWQIWTLPVPLGMFGPLQLYKDTLLASDWTTRLTAQGPGMWYASTLRPKTNLAVAHISDDVVIGISSDTSGSGLQPTSLWANRVLW